MKPETMLVMVWLFITSIVVGAIAHQAGLLGLFTPFLVFDLLFQSTR